MEALVKGIGMDRPLGRAFLGVFLLVLGLVGLGLLLYSLVMDLSIWVLGRHTEAEVVELWVERTGASEEGELTFDYFVRYRFLTPNGQVIVDTSQLDVREWGALNKGGPLDLIYFPLYPPHNRVDESRFVSVLACAYVPLILVGWACLAVGWYLLRPTEVRAWWFSRTADS
jgi:hypothetical protein